MEYGVYGDLFIVYPQPYSIDLRGTPIYTYIYGTPPPPQKPTFLVALLVFGVDLWRNLNPISLCLLATPGSGSMNYSIRD